MEKNYELHGNNKIFSKIDWGNGEKIVLKKVFHKIVGFQCTSVFELKKKRTWRVISIKYRKMWIKKKWDAGD